MKVNLSSGFLLIEVLVALVVFVIMVGALGWFIDVWLNTNTEQRCRHDALVAVCEYLERAACGVRLMDREAAGRAPILKVTAGGAADVWSSVPWWTGELNEQERPTSYHVTATAKGLGGQEVTMRVTG